MGVFDEFEQQRSSVFNTLPNTNNSIVFPSVFESYSANEDTEEGIYDGFIDYQFLADKLASKTSFNFYYKDYISNEKVYIPNFRTGAVNKRIIDKPLEVILDEDNTKKLHLSAKLNKKKGNVIKRNGSSTFSINIDFDANQVRYSKKIKYSNLDETAIEITTYSYDDYVLLSNYINIGNNPAVLTKIKKKFLDALKKAGRNKNELDFVYEQMPFFVTQTLPFKKLIGDLGILLTGDVNEIGTNEEVAILNLLVGLRKQLEFNSVLNNSSNRKGNSEFLEILISYKYGKKRLLDILLNKLDDKFGNANYTSLLLFLQETWEQSTYFSIDHPDFNKSLKFRASTGPTILPYQINKSLGFYLSNLNIEDENNVLKVTFTTYKYIENRTLEYNQGLGGFIDGQDLQAIEVEYYYHPFHPIFIAEPLNDQVIETPRLLPAFLLKASEDSKFNSNVITGIEYATDILTTITGVGNILKFRHLANIASRASRIAAFSQVAGATNIASKVRLIIGTIELSSATVSLMIKLSGTKSPLALALREYLFYLELLSLSGELSLAIKQGIRRKAKKVLKEEKALDKVRKATDNVEDKRTIDDLVRHLKESSGEGISARFAKRVSKKLDDAPNEIKAFEQNFKDHPEEWVKVINKNTGVNFHHTNLSEDSLSLNSRQLNETRQAIVTHNHPNSSGLSIADIKTMLEFGAKEIRAFGPDGSVYSMKPKGLGVYDKKDLLLRIEEIEKEFTKLNDLYPTSKELLARSQYEAVFRLLEDNVEYIQYID